MARIPKKGAETPTTQARKTRPAARTAREPAAVTGPPPTPRSREAQRNGLTGSIRTLAGQMMDIAGAAVDTSLGVGGLLARDANARRNLARAGNFLRGVREQAGLTLGEVAKALDLKDVMLLEQAESGKAALPFEVILRLAAVLARNDPIPFVLNLTDNYSPAIGRTLKTLGVGRLVEHARREHDFINIYRSRDAARRLSDEEFARVLAFVESTFDMALAFAVANTKSTKSAKASSKPRG